MEIEAVDVSDLERRLSLEEKAPLLELVRALGLRGNKNENKRVLVARLLDEHERHMRSMAVADPHATLTPTDNPGRPTFSTSGEASSLPAASTRRSKRSRHSQAAALLQGANHPTQDCLTAPASPPPPPTQASEPALSPHDQPSPSPFTAPPHPKVPRSYAAAAAGAQDHSGPPSQPGTPSPLGLCDLLDRTMALLHGAIREAQASTSSSATAARTLAGF